MISVSVAIACFTVAGAGVKRENRRLNRVARDRKLMVTRVV